MGKRIKWSTDFKRYPGCRQPCRGLRGTGKAVVHVLLVLCALYAIYAFFDKTELSPAVSKSPTVETKPGEVGVLEALGEVRVKNGL
ncbi:MAG TPA: hypothetical protein PLV31_02790 [Gammaproteobacteria bacterium]|nr:hypothetical protein [Gammaproteobacteria bacterium]